jgi:SHS2 domain-containing protein
MTTPGDAARWEHFSHGADVGIRGFGDSLEEAFEQAALALMAVVSDVSTIVQVESIEVRCCAPDRELLLVNWLNAIIYEVAVRGMLFGRFRVVTSDDSLTGTLSGEKIDPDRHQLAVEAKGATVTELRVAQDEGGKWLAQCVIDV